MKQSVLKKKVVIVEDDRLLAIVLKKMAAFMNFEVLDVTQAGKDAVKSIQMYQPDLIFMDIHLSDNMNGIDAMKKIREYSDIPVIYISAQSDPDIREEAGSVGNSSYISKPIKIDELKVALNKVQFAA